MQELSYVSVLIVDKSIDNKGVLANAALVAVSAPYWH
jgi:hypothetical protein